MELYCAEIGRSKLAGLPETERVLLLLLTHAINELTVLTKLILMARKEEPASSVFGHVEGARHSF